MAKNFEDLTFSDDFMFGKVMENNPELCKGVLELLLNTKIGELKDITRQKDIQCSADGKPIRLDIFTQDEHAIYDAEMQNLGKKSLESLQLGKRARFYQSSMDGAILEKGIGYRKLPESNIIMICTFDPFSKEYPFYTFHTMCDQDRDVELNDKTAKYFFNCTYKGNDIPQELKDFYNFVMTGAAGSRLTEDLNSAVAIARRNKIWRTEYMKELLIYDDMKEEGIEIGLEKGLDISRKVISDLVRDNIITKEDAAFRLNVTVEEFCKMMNRE